MLRITTTLPQQLLSFGYTSNNVKKDLNHIQLLNTIFFCLQFCFLYLHRLYLCEFDLVFASFLFISITSVVAVFPPPPALARVTVLQMDLETLDAGNELNDSIVDFFHDVSYPSMKFVFYITPST